jgi:hypothetical protein
VVVFAPITISLFLRSPLLHPPPIFDSFPLSLNISQSAHQTPAFAHRFCIQAASAPSLDALHSIAQTQLRILLVSDSAFLRVSGLQPRHKAAPWLLIRATDVVAFELVRLFRELELGRGPTPHTLKLPDRANHVTPSPTPKRRPPPKTD